MKIKDQEEADKNYLLNQETQSLEEITTYPQTPVKEATYKSFILIFFRIFNLCLSSFYFGYTFAYLGSYNFSEMAKLYNITSDIQFYEGFLQSIVNVGAGVGAISSRLTIAFFSRRNSVLFINFFAFVSGLMVLVPNLPVFASARFIQGICVGHYSAIIPMLIKEFSPNEIYTTFGSIDSIMISIGVVFGFTLQLILLQFSSQLEHWRVQHGFTLITIILQSIFLLFVYKQETPKYLLLKQREDLCIKFLTDMYKPKYVKFILDEKKKDFGMEKQKIQAISAHQKQQKKPQPQKSQRGKKIRIIAGIHLATLQQLLGINSIVNYGVSIVQKVNPGISKVIPIILNLVSITGGFFTIILLKRLGRVIILQGGTFFSSLSILSVAIGFYFQESNPQVGNFLVIFGLFSFMISFGATLGPIMWLYIAEIVEPQIIPFTTVANWTTSTSVTLLFPILSSLFGTPMPIFMFFATWGFLSIIISKKLLIQTKEKSQRQIKLEYCDK